MLHVWNARTFEFWNSLDFSKAPTAALIIVLGSLSGVLMLMICLGCVQECTDATSPMSFDFEGNFLVVGVPRQVVMLNFYNNAHCTE
jgi:hypothetical protein